MCGQDPIKKPIIRTESKLVKKEASEIFKFIQMYMGDRPLMLGKSGLTPLSIAVDIVCRGWTNVALRDEILIQLCRQTTRNPLPSVTYSSLYFVYILLLVLQRKLGDIVEVCKYNMFIDVIAIKPWPVPGRSGSSSI